MTDLGEAILKKLIMDKKGYSKDRKVARGLFRKVQLAKTTLF